MGSIIGSIASIGGDLLGAAEPIVGGIMGANAAKSAAEEQANALRQGLGFQTDVYDTTQQNLNPYISTGQNALYSLASLYGLSTPGGSASNEGATNAYNNFTKTPYYQFGLQQGEQAMNQSGAAKGLTLSGGQLNALQAYGQGYASQNFGNYVNQLSQLANLGQSSSTSLGSLGNNAARTVLSGETGIGNALASATMGANNALTKGIQNALPGAGNGISGIVSAALKAAQGSSSGGSAGWDVGAAPASAYSNPWSSNGVF